MLSQNQARPRVVDPDTFQIGDVGMVAENQKHLFELHDRPYEIVAKIRHRGGVVHE